MVSSECIGGIEYEVTYDQNAAVSSLCETNLEKVTIPDNVQIDENEYKVTIINEHVFEKSAITSIEFGNNIVSIGAYAFSETRNLQGNITFPNSLRELGDYVFHLSSLKGIIINEGIETIPYCAFDGSDLEYVSFPDSLINIGEFAFSETKISQLIFGNNIESIGWYAFHKTRNLQGNITLPNSLRELGDNVFQYSTLKGIIINEGIETIPRSAFTHSYLEYVSFPDSLINIEKHAFSDTQISELNFGNNLKIIGESAFDTCPNLQYLQCPESLREICDDAFFFSNLKGVTFNKDLEKIGDRAFLDVLSLTAILFLIIFMKAMVKKTMQSMIKNFTLEQVLLKVQI